MAKKKNDKKSPSLNDKNKKTAARTASAPRDDSDARYTDESEFLKEEFANEYAEREMLIDEAAADKSTLKEIDAPAFDLSAEVNVDLSIGLEDSESVGELTISEDIAPEAEDSFTLEIEPIQNDAVQLEDGEKTDEAPAPILELTLDEGEPISEPNLTEAPIVDEVKLEISEEVVGFDFGSEADESVELSLGASKDESLDTNSDIEAVAINLSDDLKDNTTQPAPEEDAKCEDSPALTEDAEAAPRKKPKPRKQKKQQNDLKDEDDTTIVDAVAKEIENEARQTLIQKALEAEEAAIEEDAVENEPCDEPSDEPCAPEEEVCDKTTDEAADDALAEAPEVENGEDDTDNDNINEDEKDEDAKEDSAHAESIAQEALSEEEEYKRALAIRDKRLKTAKSAFDFLELFVFTLAAVLLITTFFVRHSIVEGDSMLGTLKDGQSLLISNFMYDPEVGDIIVVEDYTTQLKKPIVKRIIAVGGQTVKITRHGVYVDGVLLDEPYVYTDGVAYEYSVIPADALLENETLVTGYNYYELVVPEGELFVMGDHRNMSMDSRNIGTVREDAILGKVLVRIAPFDEFEFFN